MVVSNMYYIEDHSHSQNLDLRKGIAEDRDLNNIGPASTLLGNWLVSLFVEIADTCRLPPRENEKREKEEDEDEDEDEGSTMGGGQLGHGRVVAQSGQSVARRSRRHFGHIPLFRFLEGCF
nr:hypothetical protein [Tanacetum cinerariifolium]